ncbi:MAG: helix-turn-helix transcriptional regulator [Gordonia sp. (in: high G+C Gram-positive bacteria)]|uniref:helix-turn-helix domain-containing protein n=1 Tax=Gordonia sp. (in: high G+C Gram-positive bacteria) TaxID=84139 RepID=UPI003C7330EC
MTNSQVEVLLSKQLGVQIARRRHELALSQEALAEAVGISANHIQLLESGLSDRKKRSPANPRLNTLVALSRALQLPLTELIGNAVRGADLAD